MVETTIPRIPLATYRLQFRNGMTFVRAAELIPHWQSLGISHLYASPIFRAVSGSNHGYDVADYDAIDPAIGGIEGFVRLSDALLAAGIGLILDIVPNHMAASLENPYWRDVLKWGSTSPSAALFDNRWDRKLTLAVLAEPLQDVITTGHGALRWQSETAELVFDYHGSRYPLNPATYPQALRPEHRNQVLATLAEQATPNHIGPLSAHMAELFETTVAEEMLLSRPDEVMALLENQVWQMIHWRDAPKGLSYRRFFEIAGLVGVRVEDPAVFDATHRLILALVAEGRVQGLRVDHVDGLADPKAYLQQLRSSVGPDLYVVVEKILEGDEQLPADWPVHGTTGYEFISDLASLLAADGHALDGAWQAVAPSFGTPHAELACAKNLMIHVNFEGEVNALIRQAQCLARKELRPDLSDDMLGSGVRALVSGFHVYRTYGTTDGLADHDRHVLKELIDRLEKSDPQMRPALSFLQDVLQGKVGAKSRAEASTFRTRLQQLTGPVLAKSLEDTFFYRYNRLIGLNEVGGDPIGRLGGIDHFHRRMATRNATQPHGLSTTSTHDTKRGEDARARLYALSEAPEDWIGLTERWRREMSCHVKSLTDGPAPEPAVEWLLFQALAGMLPHDFDPENEKERDAAQARFLPYVEKALREAKLRTNWSDIDKPYEDAVGHYAAAAIGTPSFIIEFWRDIRPFVRTGMINSLTQILLKLTAPGIPDIYQGTETSDTSLVDPDNRRIPEHQRLAVLGEAPPLSDFRATKTWLIGRVLDLRRRFPDLFAQGDYIPRESIGPRAGNVVAFARRWGGHTTLVVAPRLVHGATTAGTLLSAGYWGDTAIKLPEGMVSLADMLGETNLEARNGVVAMADLFRLRPFALLQGQS
jgi:(1->4)-alpha-D-glucan 1-alpha-D-glucosylmutase